MGTDVLYLSCFKYIHVQSAAWIWFFKETQLENNS